MPDTSAAWSIVGSLAPVAWLNALVLCGLLILALTPLFRNFAVAIPTHRSSHRSPTPQWGGLAISVAALGVSAGAMLLSGLWDEAARNGVLMALLAALLMVLLGAADDHFELDALAKLAVQAAAVALMLGALPEGMRALPFFPYWLERGLLFVGALWFINLVNFMDGIDWMMVAEVVPVTAGIAVIGALGALPARGPPCRARTQRRHAGLCAVQSARGAAVHGRHGQSSRSGCCSPGCSSWWPAPGISWRPCCCRCILSPIRASRCCAARAPAKSHGWRIAPTSISAPATTASPTWRSCGAYSWSTSGLWCWPRSASST